MWYSSVRAKSVRRGSFLDAYIQAIKTLTTSATPAVVAAATSRGAAAAGMRPDAAAGVVAAPVVDGDGTACSIRGWGNAAANTAGVAGGAAAEAPHEEEVRGAAFAHAVEVCGGDPAAATHSALSYPPCWCPRRMQQLLLELQQQQRQCKQEHEQQHPSSPPRAYHLQQQQQQHLATLEPRPQSQQPCNNQQHNWSRDTGVNTTSNLSCTTSCGCWSPVSGSRPAGSAAAAAGLRLKPAAAEVDVMAMVTAADAGSAAAATATRQLAACCLESTPSSSATAYQKQQQQPAERSAAGEASQQDAAQQTARAAGPAGTLMVAAAAAGWQPEPPAAPPQQLPQQQLLHTRRVASLQPPQQQHNGAESSAAGADGTGMVICSRSISSISNRGSLLLRSFFAADAAPPTAAGGLCRGEGCEGAVFVAAAAEHQQQSAVNNAKADDEASTFIGGAAQQQAPQSGFGQGLIAATTPAGQPQPQLQLPQQPQQVTATAVTSAAASASTFSDTCWEAEELYRDLDGLLDVLDCMDAEDDTLLHVQPPAAAGETGISAVAMEYQEQQAAPAHVAVAAALAQLGPPQQQPPQQQYAQQQHHYQQALAALAAAPVPVAACEPLWGMDAAAAAALLPASAVDVAGAVTGAAGAAAFSPSDDARQPPSAHTASGRVVMQVMEAALMTSVAAAAAAVETAAADAARFPVFPAAAGWLPTCTPSAGHQPDVRRGQGAQQQAAAAVRQGPYGAPQRQSWPQPLAPQPTEQQHWQQPAPPPPRHGEAATELLLGRQLRQPGFIIPLTARNTHQQQVLQQEHSPQRRVFSAPFVPFALEATTGIGGGNLHRPAAPAGVAAGSMSSTAALLDPMRALSSLSHGAATDACVTLGLSEQDVSDVMRGMEAAAAPQPLAPPQPLALQPPQQPPQQQQPLSSPQAQLTHPQGVPRQGSPLLLSRHAGASAAATAADYVWGRQKQPQRGDVAAGAAGAHHVHTMVVDG
ncbi:hypothetical protein HXX76_007896 [Chlamydomonas incerta]|uniref:Uncharacterized protein n=1 Tax=Chlamydomonas incerta TaxID=51695 RepID=A0A835SVV7_CHLIN|nr:hypothetical protein HXX76_007896 [Chlamydomonas incerta]|eukprot:KAG2434169.1 hypothetical protein HXX76_007896 [Chlamydomonas incerta]